MASQQPPHDPRFGALLEALCCVMAVDSKVKTSERNAITKILLKVKAPFTPEEIDAAITDFISRVRSSEFSSIVNAAIQNLVTNAANESDKRVYLQSLVMVANADKSVHQQERVLVSRFQAALAGGSARTTPEEKHNCPQCQAGLPGDAVLCVSCGYNFRTKKQVVTEFGRAVDDGWHRKFAGRRFNVVKSADETPKLVVKRCVFWFIPFSRREYPLSSFCEVGTSIREIISREKIDESDYRYHDAQKRIFGRYLEEVVGEKMRVHLVPQTGQREIVFTFAGYYASFNPVNLLMRLIGLGRSRYTATRASYSNLINLIRAAHPLPLLPRS